MTPYELSERAKAIVTLSGLSDLIETEICSTRRRTIEECAKVADRIASAYNDDKDGDADARVASEWVASEIRSLTQPNLGKE